MPSEVEIRLRGEDSYTQLPARAELVAAGNDAASSFEAAREGEGVHLLFEGARAFHVRVVGDLDEDARGLLVQADGRRALLKFEGRTRSLRQRLSGVGGRGLTAEPESLDLTQGIYGAPPLYLRPDGTLSASAEGDAPRGLDAATLATMVNAARWVSTRRTTSFERLFPPSPFHPDEPVREERLSLAQGEVMLAQLRDILAAAKVGVAAPEGMDAVSIVQLRSAALTVLSHLVATAIKDPEFRPVSDGAIAAIWGLIDGEQGEGSRAELRAHALQLLSQRGPALSEEDGERVKTLRRALRRSAPPYDELGDTWRFAVASAHDFHPGEYEILHKNYKYKALPEVPADAPKPPGWSGYKVLEAPFTGPNGQRILVFMRSSRPREENFEMSHRYFCGHIVSRHANLGSNDMAASTVAVRQEGYKLQMNCQCAGLTTRFAIARMFPEADIYSSWDSTYFRTDNAHKIIDSEAMDSFHALLQGLAAGETYEEIDARLIEAQWYHKQDQVEGFVQFIGPAHPAVIARYEDINHDGKADYYDGFLDFTLVEIGEDVRDAGVARDPGVAASQVSGAAARGLGWSAGSLNRVTQYSELWDELPGHAERFYAFRGAGFYSPGEPPRDVAVGSGPAQELGRLPAVVRYMNDEDVPGGLAAEVMFNSWLSHAPQELKRMLIAAEAWWRAVDLGHLGGQAPIDTPLGQRGGVLILLASLLEYPADQNRLGQLWDRALQLLGLPPISRSLVRRCNTKADHNNGNYYGSRRGIRQLIGEGENPGDLQRGDPLAFEKLARTGEGDELIGRPRVLDLEAASRLAEAEARERAAAEAAAGPSADATAATSGDSDTQGAETTASDESPGEETPSRDAPPEPEAAPSETADPPAAAAPTGGDGGGGDSPA